MKKVILFIIIGLIVLGLIGNVLYPETEEQKNTQVLNERGVHVTSKKTTQGDSCLIEILVTSKNEDLKLQGFTVEAMDTSGTSLTFDFVKMNLKKDIAQQELKRFSMTCEKIIIRNVTIKGK